ncbi:hypothetical protein ACOSQ4_008330 [Xanthoceras sorbifolium]
MFSFLTVLTLSMTTSMVSLPADLGSPSMKSIAISSHGKKEKKEKEEEEEEEEEGKREKET